MIMSRPKKDSGVRQAMCDRFVVAIGKLGMSTSELARALGYANVTTIAKVQRGQSFVDVERLYLLANLKTLDGSRIDLNWLIAGQEEEKT